MGASGGQQAAEAARMERPRLPRDLYAVQPAKVAAFLATGVGTFAGFGLLGAWIAQSHLPLALRLVLAVGCVIAAAQGAHLLGFAGHEGIHVMLHPNKWTSTLLGAFFSAATSFPALGYGVAHWNHHRYTNQASDPDAALYPQFRTFWRRFFFARGAGSRAHMRNLLLMARGRALPLGYRLPFTLEEQRTLARINLAFLAFWFGLYVALAYHAPWTALFAIGLPLVAVIPLSGLRDYVEHAGTGLGMFRDSRCFTHPLYTLLFFRAFPATTCRRCIVCSPPAATSPAGARPSTRRSWARSARRRASRSILRPTSPTSRTTPSRRRSPTTPRHRACRWIA